MFRDLLGKPFKYGGRGPLEYDCYGLCMEIFRRRGVKLPDYGSAVQQHVIGGMVEKHRSEFIELAAPQPYCLVLFRIHPRYVSHIGVVLEDCSRFIHIMKTTSVCIERLDGETWKRRIAGYITI